MQLSSCIEDSVPEIGHLNGKGGRAVLVPGGRWHVLGCQALLQPGYRRADLSSQLNDFGQGVGRCHCEGEQQDWELAKRKG